MSEWQIEDEADITLDGSVESIDVHLVAGAVTVAVADGPPRVVIGHVRGGPVVVTQAGGTVAVRHLREGDDAGHWEDDQFASVIGGVLENILSSVRGALDGWSHHRFAEVSILVPEPPRVRARTTSASILLSGVVDSSARSVSGEITASGTRGSLRLKTVSGSIAAAYVDGTLALKTVSGEITVARSSLAALRAHTVSGDLLVDADLSAGTHSVEGVSGDVVVRLAPDTGLELDASTVSGGLSCAIGEPQTDTRPGSRRLHVRNGDGGARIRCHTVSGSLTVLERDETADAA